MSYTARRINALAQKLSAQTYLEIGVDKGLTFTAINVPERTAVDPEFRFDTTPLTNDKTHFHQQSSDQFFAMNEALGAFDLIFIDGLHHFEQVVRDLSNALMHSHAGSVIILDDTKPNDVYSAIPSANDTMKFRRLAGIEDFSWHGDVYKIVFYIHDFWPSLNYRTIVGSGNPQTLVWRSRSFERKPRLNSFEAISRLSYFQLIDNIDALREGDEASIIAEVTAELKGSHQVPPIKAEHAGA
jgi:hypothetical protein